MSRDDDMRDLLVTALVHAAIDHLAHELEDAEAARWAAWQELADDTETGECLGRCVGAEP